MEYRSESIQTTVSRLNSQYFLPAIQREFVWTWEQIIQLFDSILRGYPISSFLFWELKPENRDKWEAYTFVHEGKDGGVHNVLANTNGVQNLTLVLDGQQRLTSLLIGLKGAYCAKKKFKRRGNPDAWVRQTLYLDLLKDPRTDDDGNTSEIGVYYGLAFLDKAPTPNTRHYWLKVGKILDYDTETDSDEFKKKLQEQLPRDITLHQSRIFHENLERLYQAVWKDKVIAYYTENDQDYDRVLDIFVRANEGGTKLSKSDLLLSMITSKWDGINARDEICTFVDRLNWCLTKKNKLNKDFIMKSCLVLSDLPVAYKVQNFNNENLALIQKNWARIKSAMERGIDLANSFGIDRENLTASNALIPIIYYLYQRPDWTFRGTSTFEVRNARRIRQWLVMALLNGVFGGSSDSTLHDTRMVLQEFARPQDDFPSDQLNAKAGRRAAFTDDTLDDILLLTYGKQRTFLVLSLLYDECGWGTMDFHQDHIFPRSLFTARSLAAANRTSWDGMGDRLGNLALLWSRENQEKSDQPFEAWLATRDPSFKKRHLIPDNPSLWKFDRFDDFLAAREELIKKRLVALLGVPIVHPGTFRIEDSDRTQNSIVETGPVEDTSFAGELETDCAEEDQKEQKRYEFFEQLLHRCRQKTGLFSNVAAVGYQSWVSASAGRNGTLWQFAVEGSVAHVELCFCGPIPWTNRKRLMALYINREEIEQSFGERLLWNIEEARKQHYVRSICPIGGLKEEVRWQAIQDDLVDRLIRLEASLGDLIKHID